MKTSYEDHYYTIQGQKIHTVEAGQPGRQVALLMHGWSSSWFALSPLIDLVAQRFRVVAVDLPGYGKSPRLNERTTIYRYAELMAELIEEISDTSAVLIGHSMGGMISLNMALRYPLLVERMVLLNPTITGRLSLFINLFISPITILERFRLGSFIVSLAENSIIGLTDRLMRPVSLAYRSGMSKEDYDRIKADVRRPGQGRVRAECFRAMLDNDLSKRIGRLRIPALVIWGAEDNTVPLRDAGVVADEWPQADLRIFPNAGHWTHFEAADLTRRQVAAYLGLPKSDAELITAVADKEIVRIDDVARFLALSDVGTDLNIAQRTRLAAQCEQKTFEHGEVIAHVNEVGNELFIIQSGTVDIWREPSNSSEAHQHDELIHVASFRPGQITGELAMLDQEARSADLIAGEEGATVLTLQRERLLALCEDDAVLGTQLLWNISRAMSGRVRFILWQLNRSEQRRELATQDVLEAVLG